MSRYIDADKAKEKLGVVRGAYSCFLEEDRPYYDVLSETIKMINEMPTADVRENIRGEWRTTYFDHVAMGERPKILYCSVCNQCIAYPTNYCPNCGADMRPREMGEHADITIIEESVCADRRCES